ncbi:MAG: ribosomal protein S18-alanine N-acetyltransferase [Deltaproteobacteria bacterium]|nr:ribosomal protein S18-alanine N-acetyltransferase [Deltaproteobacteria bacterium]
MKDLALAFMKARFLRQVLAIERASFADPWPPSAFVAEMQHVWSWFKVAGPAGEGGPAQVDAFIIAWMLKGEMHLLNIAVSPPRRRHGLARAMLSDAFSAFSNDGGGLVSLEVRPSNGSALGLYTGLGFRQIGLRRGYYHKQNEDAIVMGLSLPAAPPGSRQRSREGGCR